MEQLCRLPRLMPSQQNSGQKRAGPEVSNLRPRRRSRVRRGRRAGDEAKVTLLTIPPMPGLQPFAWQENQGSISNNPLVGCGAAYGVLGPERRSPMALIHTPRLLVRGPFSWLA